MAEDGDGEATSLGTPVKQRAAFVSALKEQTNFFQRYDPSVCYKGPALPVVKSCWSQIQGKMVEVVEIGHNKVLEKYQVLGKLQQLDEEKSKMETQTQRPPQSFERRMRSVIEDSQRLCLPEYKAALAKLEKEDEDLATLLEERQQELQELLAQESLIIDRLDKMQSEIMTS